MPARPGGFRPRSSVDVVPDRRLEFVPVPSSRGDLDDLLQEHSYLDSLEATANAVCAAAVRMAQAACAKKLVTEVDGLEVSFADRRKAIRNAITTYVQMHHDEVFGDAKTAKFNFGTLKLRGRPRGIAIREGLTDEDVKARLDKLSGLSGKITRWLAGKVFAQPLAVFYRIKSEINWQALKPAVLDGRVRPRDAHALGLECSGGEDELSIDVAQWTVQSQSRMQAETTE